MRYPLRAIGAVALLTVVVAIAAEPADPPKLGPEWTYDKEMRHYKKMMPIKVVRASAALSGQNYYLDLQHDKLLVYESGDNSSTEVRVNDTISLEIQKNPKGGPAKISFGANKCGYADLDGDGIWDGWYDSRRGDHHKRYIWRDGAWVPVCLTKAGFGDGPELSLDRNTEYTWDGKEWKSRPVDR